MTAPVIMWFRQDLRVSGNAALAAAAAAGPVIPVYILDDATPGRWRWGGASRWWLHHSLASLGQTIPLVLRQGQADAVLEKLLAETGAAAIHFTRDYAPWSGALEARVKAACGQAGVQCRRFGGFLLHEPEAVRNGAGEPYRVYTPFSRACFATGEPKPPLPRPPDLHWQPAVASPPLTSLELLPRRPDWARGFATHWQPGEAGAQARLATFLDDALQDYPEHRDRPDLPGTSRLSPHLHWGELSPAQVWTATRAAMAAAGGRFDQAGEKFLKELLWREFSYHLLHHWPQFPETAFRPEFEAFPWSSDVAARRTWERGETGYPIVDAGLRELWSTGFMHNRVRMIAASFLIKDLLIPWQHGEEWFWDTLVDADIGNNSASWQWVAGSGADASPYFRVFNPVLQGEKFDPDGAYVRRFIPELVPVPDKLVHKPWEWGGKLDYPPPMIDHAVARDRALAAYKTLRGATS